MQLIWLSRRKMRQKNNEFGNDTRKLRRTDYFPNDFPMTRYPPRLLTVIKLPSSGVKVRPGTPTFHSIQQISD